MGLVKRKATNFKYTHTNKQTIKHCWSVILVERHANTSTLLSYVPLASQNDQARQTRWKWGGLIIVSVRKEDNVCAWGLRMHKCMHAWCGGGGRGGGGTPCFIEVRAARSLTARHVHYEMPLDTADRKGGRRVRACASILYNLYLCPRLLFIWKWINDSEWNQLQLEVEQQLSVVENRNVRQTFFKRGLKPRKRLMCSS